VKSFLAEYRAFVEERVAEQIARYRRANPNCDLRAAVKVQIDQEKARLQRLIDDPETPPNHVKVWRATLVEYLPLLERKLTGR